MDKRRYFTRRIANAMLTIILIAGFNFLLFRVLPGDPARLLAPKGRFSQEAIEKQRKAFGLDKPLWQQFGLYWWQIGHLEFGYSMAEKRPVTDVIRERIMPTVWLVGVGTLIATVIGLVTGVFAGWKRSGQFDFWTTNTGMFLYAMPTFFSGMLFIMFFATKLGWFPVGKMSEAGAVYSSWFDQALDFVHHLTLPALAFALTYMGEYHLIMRSSLTGVMNEDYVLTARAKGLSDNRVLWRHVTPNAMLPTVTLVMMNLGFVMTGAILSETVFTWPGLGLLQYDAMNDRDFPVLQAVFLLASIAVIIANLVADLMYYYFDPRVKA